MGKRNAPRDAAIARGDIHFIGKPCKKNHYPKRYVANYNCVQCDKENNIESQRRYRAEGRHAEYQRAYHFKYRADPAKKEILNASKQRYYIKKFYNNDPEYYAQRQMEKQERSAELRAEEKERDLRRNLREHKAKHK